MKPIQRAFLLIATLLFITLSLLFVTLFHREFLQHPLIAPFATYDANLEKNVSAEREPIVYLYVTVVGPDPKYRYSFQDINRMNLEDSFSMDDPMLPVIVQEGDADGPREGGYGYGVKEANATIELRGNTTRNADLKSYKLKLNETAEPWRDWRVINLNKHPYDHTRVRNKLSFDYLQTIPHITGFDTQFVRLFVKDLTARPADSAFQDYGLFTQIEQPNKRFLQANGMDENGYLYQAKNFEFYRYPDKLRDRTDPLYDRDVFDTVLEIDGREYHTKLLHMLEDVNDLSLDINEVIEKHFVRENYLTWLAVNILFGNLDTSSQNFYLYSSVYSDSWYFLPWDYDGAWDYYWQWDTKSASLPPWRAGISNYWGSVLHRRFIQDPDNVKDLSEKIDSLTRIINKKRTQAYLDAYFPIVHPIVTQPPDVNLLPDPVSRYDEEFYSLVHVTEKNKRLYEESLEKPMPVFTGGPWFEGEKWSFTWWESYDIQGDELFYDFQISRTPDFTNLAYEAKRLQSTEIRIDPLPEGAYYWRVIVRDAKGHTQVPFESYVDEDGVYYHGVKTFTIE